MQIVLNKENGLKAEIKFCSKMELYFSDEKIIFFDNNEEESDTYEFQTFLKDYSEEAVKSGLTAYDAVKHAEFQREAFEKGANPKEDVIFQRKLQTPGASIKPMEENKIEIVPQTPNLDDIMYKDVEKTHQEEAENIIKVHRKFHPALSSKVKKKRQSQLKSKIHDLQGVKEKILQFLEKKGGKGTFCYNYAAHSKKEAIEEARRIQKEVSCYKLSLIKGLKELIAEGKLKKENGKGVGPGKIYTIIEPEKEHNIIPEPPKEIPEKIHTEEKKEILPKEFIVSPGLKAKPLSTYQKIKLKKRCLRCNSQLEVQDLRSSEAREIALFSEEMREFLHCICCGQDYYPEAESEVKKVA